MLLSVKKIACCIDEKKYENLQEIVDKCDILIRDINFFHLSIEEEIPQELIFKAECIQEIQSLNIKRLNTLREECAINVRTARNKELLTKKYAAPQYNDTGELLDFRE